MNKRVPAVWAIGLVLAGAAPGGEARAANPSGEVRIGMIRSMFRDMPEAMLAPLSKPFQALIKQQTGVGGELDLCPDAETLARRIADGNVHLGVFHGFEYAWLKEQYPDLQPLVIAVPTTRKFKACLVVRDDSPCKAWADFRGKRIALPKGSREHCRLFLERNRCRRTECQVLCPATVEDALDDVVDGVADATVVDDGAIDSFARRKPGRSAKLKVLCESEVFPPSVIVYRRDSMDEGTVQRFRQGLVTAHHTTMGRRMMMLWRLSCFAAVPADYSAQLSAILKAYPPPAAERESDAGGK